MDFVVKFIRGEHYRDSIVIEFEQALCPDDRDRLMRVLSAAVAMEFAPSVAEDAKSPPRANALEGRVEFAKPWAPVEGASTEYNVEGI